ncbi:MAG TPA: tyrosine--tRNA ligase [Candidatus Saccharimonadales bacterium]|nr:tyrosine--tRNA ligase [Candidatus Saccharimonadales bacterium]
MANNQKIKELLSRGVEEVIDLKDLETKLLSGKPLRVKLGIDPTSPNIHLGRSIPLLKLRDFQELGHQIVFIIGDFTGTIGDTSDKNSERPMLDEKIIKANIKNYIEQAGKVIDVSKCEVHYNSEWLAKLEYKEVCRQADIFSINEFISRDNIRRRLDAGSRVSLREVMYPMMQGYDSVMIKADVELGGTDQRFNLLAGREMQRTYGQVPQNIITNPLIEGLDGRKMSSSWGNTVNLFDSPLEMFGKIMSMQDEFIIKYFTLLTRVSVEEINKYEELLKKGANPRDYKILLAKEIVRFYHNEQMANEQEANFIKVFSRKEMPAEIAELKPASYDLVAVLIESGLASSKSEAKRVIEQGGVKINQQVIKELDFIIPVGAILQKGKLKFLKIN